MTDLTEQITTGLALETEGSEQAAIDYFRALAERYPDHALVQFELAGAYDFAGFEAEAIPHYRRAIELGLPENYQPRVALQLGSSLRNVGQHAEAVAILRAACERFPQHRALRAFLALALVSAGDAPGGVVELLDVLLRTDAFEAYQRSLRYYAEDLRGTALPPHKD